MANEIILFSNCTLPWKDNLLTTLESRELERTLNMMVLKTNLHRVLNSLLVVPAGKTVSASFDVSAGYDMSETGTYTIAVDTYIEYVEINVKGNGKPPIPKRAEHLSSLLVMFNVTENPSRKTLGEKARSLEANGLGKRSQIGKCSS